MPNIRNGKVTIIEYVPSYRQEFIDISLKWLQEYNILEDLDIEIVNNPEKILKEGGHIFFAKYQENDSEEIIGTVALSMIEDNAYELIKCGVKEAFKGFGVGKMLVKKAIETARIEGKKRIKLTSNHQLKVALSMYESLGFKYKTVVQSQFELADIEMELILVQ